MQDRSARLHRFIDVDYPGQYFVIYLDQFERLGGDLLRGGGDGSHRMTGKQSLIPRHNVTAHPAHILNADDHRLVQRNFDDILCRHYGLDTRQRCGIIELD